MVDAALLPPSLQDERGLVFLQLAGSAAAIDLDQTQIYWIAQAPAAALPALAVQSGLLEDPGWVLATTDDERRALLMEAFLLSSRRGTPWALKRALTLIGWPGMVLQEGLPSHRLDGSWLLNGAIDLGQGITWARFRVTQPLPDKPITPETLTQLIRVINAWKPCRCWLDAIAFTLEFTSHLRTGFLDGSWLLDGYVSLYGRNLDEVATAGFGPGGLTHSVPAIVDDSRADEGWLSVRFEIDDLTANGELLDTFALLDAEGGEILRLTRSPITKTPGLSLECTWNIDTEGRPA